MSVLLIEAKSLSRVPLFATPWTVVFQAPPSMEFSRPEYWSGLPFLSPGGLPNPGIKPMSPALQAGALPSEPPGKQYCWYLYKMMLSKSFWLFNPMIFLHWLSLFRTNAVKSVMYLVPLINYTSERAKWKMMTSISGEKFPLTSQESGGGLKQECEPLAC